MNMCLWVNSIKYTKPFHSSKKKKGFIIIFISSPQAGQQLCMLPTACACMHTHEWKKTSKNYIQLTKMDIQLDLLYYKTWCIFMYMNCNAPLRCFSYMHMHTSMHECNAMHIHSRRRRNTILHCIWIVLANVQKINFKV